MTQFICKMTHSYERQSRHLAHHSSPIHTRDMTHPYVFTWIKWILWMNPVTPVTGMNRELRTLALMSMSCIYAALSYLHIDQGRIYTWHESRDAYSCTHVDESSDSNESCHSNHSHEWQSTHLALAHLTHSRCHLEWHFRKLFQSSKLKARTFFFTETWQKRRSNFELWAFENDTPSGIGCTSFHMNPVTGLTGFIHRIHWQDSFTWGTRPRMEKSHSCWPRTIWCVVNMFRNNGMRPLIIPNGTKCYSILYCNSQWLYIRLKYMYSQ